jgi:hypothetical protein
MAEIAGLLAAALTDLGYEVVSPSEGLPEPGRGRVNVVVAPHEFFPLYQGASDDELMRAAEASVTVGVEQPGTLWFEFGARFSEVARAVFDISGVAVAELRRRGIEARHLQLGYHHSWDHWGGGATPRTNDVLFLGSVTPRRERVLSEIAGYLWECESDIRLFEFPKPMAKPRGHFVTGPEKYDLLSDSRILLNIHRGEVAYFEWVRVLDAVANGCLVVTETSEEYGPLVPGEHLVAVPSDVLGAYAASLTIDESLRAELAQNAYDFVRAKLEMTTLLEPLCADMRSGSRRAEAAAPVSQVLAPPVAPPPAQPLISEVLASETRVRRRVKELIDSETALIRTVEAMQSELRFGDADHVVAWSSPAWHDFQPTTTVVIAAYNSERFVADAVASVFDSTGCAMDLVVVDDHSGDGTVEIVRAAMESFPEFPVRLVARAANGGVSVARNRALQEARGEYVFILDADNRVYPNGIARLTAAMQSDPAAAFAYGIIATNPPGELVSRLPWDVPRMCESNYVDAMALIRRSALDEVGGYDLYFGLVGWEDYELWLRFAAAGWSPVFVPSFIGEYTVRSGSRQEVVNLDNPALFAELRRRFSYLPWP